MDPQTVFVLGTLLKPLGLVAFFFLAYVLARGLHRLIPDGKVKHVLYDKTLQARHPWKVGLGFMFAGYAAMGIIAFLVW